MVEAIGALSRRSTRIYEEEQGEMRTGQSATTSNKSRSTSPDENDEPREAKPSNTSAKQLVPRVDLPREMSNTQDDMGKQVVKSLQEAAQVVELRIDDRPLNFGVVSSGNIYRSSMPVVEDFQYLETLGLKTILSLVRKDFTPDFQSFMQRNSIRHRVIDLPGTKIPITEELMASIMKIVLDKENYPILIHCNHGKHRTGCAIAVFRHVSGWSIDSIVDEYQGFAQPKVRTCDITYISNYQVSSLQRLFVKERIYRTRPVLSHDKMVRMLMFSVIVLAIWLTTLICM